MEAEKVEGFVETPTSGKDPEGLRQALEDNAPTGPDSIGIPGTEGAELETGHGQREAALASLEAEVAQLKGQVASAVAGYREALLAQFPQIPGEMVRGETAEEVLASLQRAKELVERVRTHLAASSAERRVPAGSPPRRPPDLSSLSPMEKIAHGLAQRGP